MLEEVWNQKVREKVWGGQSVCIQPASLCVFGQQAQLLCPDLNGHTHNRVKMSMLHSKAAQGEKRGQISRWVVVKTLHRKRMSVFPVAPLTSLPEDPLGGAVCH